MISFHETRTVFTMLLMLLLSINLMVLVCFAETPSGSVTKFRVKDGYNLPGIPAEVSPNEQRQKEQQHDIIPPPLDGNKNRNPLIELIDEQKFKKNHSYYHDIIPNGTTLLTKCRISLLNEDYPDLTAIIHIGMMKTGSTAIQWSFRNFLRAKDPKNASDNYVEVNNYMELRTGRQDLKVNHLLGCFRQPSAPTVGFIYCKPEMLPIVQEVASVGHNNIIVSGEYLSFGTTNIQALKEYLSPWKHHRIIIYYRRYFDWIRSLHNQAVKQQPTPNRLKLTDYLVKESSNGINLLVDGFQRWKHHYDDIVVINSHECPDGDVRDCFYCLALINATELCDKYRLQQKISASDLLSNRGSNPTIVLIYEDLAYYAKELNLWSETDHSDNPQNVWTMQEVSRQVQYHQEHVLNLTQYDFGIAKECPSEETSQYILQQSLDNEKMFFPEYYKQTGEQEIREAFAVHIQTKLCYINPLKVLQQDNDNGTIWRNFFTKILPTRLET